MKERLNKYIANSSVIKLSLNVEEDEDDYYGIPIRISSRLMAFHELDEFHFNGYRVVRLKYIVGVRRSKFETISQAILKKTNELEKHSTPSWLRVGSWKSLLASLKSRDICISVASGLVDSDVFAVGKIHDITDDAVVLRSFDSHGKWIEPRHRIKFSEITEVNFGDEYSERFNEFMETR